MKHDIRLHQALARAFSKGVMTGQQVADFIAIYRGLK